MTDKTFTDEEIVKALEHCSSSCGSDACKGCPFDETEACYDRENIIAVEALAVINRQKAEIERLTVNMNAFALGMRAEKERADGIVDEFAERMKKALTMEYHGIKISVKAESIDKIAEEMKGPTATEAKDFYSAEEVRKMTPKEVKENYSAIMDSMKKWS